MSDENKDKNKDQYKPDKDAEDRIIEKEDKKKKRD